MYVFSIVVIIKILEVRKIQLIMIIFGFMFYINNWIMMKVIMGIQIKVDRRGDKIVDVLIYDCSVLLRMFMDIV